MHMMDMNRSGSCAAEQEIRKSLALEARLGAHLQEEAALHERENVGLGSRSRRAASGSPAIDKSTVSIPSLQEKLGWGRRGGNAMLQRAASANARVRNGSLECQQDCRESISLGRRFLSTSSSVSTDGRVSLSCSSDEPHLSSISMHKRLSMLEERVSGIATELRGTKDVLDSFNPAWSKGLLAEIQSKISILETAMILHMGAVPAPVAQHGSCVTGNLPAEVKQARESSVQDLCGILGQEKESIVDFCKCKVPSDTVEARDAGCLPAVARKGVVTQSNDDGGEKLHRNLQQGQSIEEEFVRQTLQQIPNAQDVDHSPSPVGQGSCNYELDTGTSGTSTLSDISHAGKESNHKGHCLEDSCRVQSVVSTAESLVTLSASRGSKGPRTLDLSRPSYGSEGGKVRGSSGLPVSVDRELDTQVERCSGHRMNFSQSEPCQIPPSNAVTLMWGMSDSHVDPQGVTYAPSLRDPTGNKSVSLHNDADGTMEESWEDLLLSADQSVSQHCGSTLPLWPNKPAMSEDRPHGKLHKMGHKTATAGWFVCEGEGVVLAHEDGSCSFYDVANMEEKVEFKSPLGLGPGAWQDCWLIRAAGADGRSNKYVVAASAAGATDAGFCVWDFQERNVAAYHCETSSMQPTAATTYVSNIANVARQCLSERQYPAQRPESSPTLKSMQAYPMNSLKGAASHSPLWWYRPCGPLLASAGSGLNTLALYDIRDGDIVTRWQGHKRVAGLKFCSPLQWRDKGKIVVACEESVGVWDVNSMAARSIHSANFAGSAFSAMHIPNADAECSGGVWQRRPASENGKCDGLLCSERAINILDFRLPTAVALRIPLSCEEIQSIYANGDSIFTGVRAQDRRSLALSPGPSNDQHSVLQWSIRQGKPMCAYKILGRGEGNSVCQVWGSSETVMAVDNDGLCIFDAATGFDGQQAGIRARIPDGTNDLVDPTFDYSCSRILLISRDRPANWCHWP